MDDKGESPIEVMGTIFIGLFAMTLVIFSVGPIIDGFVYILSGIGVQIYDPRIKDMFTSIMRYYHRVKITNQQEECNNDNQC